MRKAELKPASMEYLEAFKDQDEDEIEQCNFCLILVRKIIPMWYGIFALRLCRFISHY